MKRNFFIILIFVVSSCTRNTCDEKRLYFNMLAISDENLLCLLTEYMDLPPQNLDYIFQLFVFSNDPKQTTFVFDRCSPFSNKLKYQKPTGYFVLNNRIVLFYDGLADFCKGYYYNKKCEYLQHDNSKKDYGLSLNHKSNNNIYPDKPIWVITYNKDLKIWSKEINNLIFYADS